MRIVRNILFLIIIGLVSFGCEWGFDEKETMQSARQYQVSGKHNAAIIELKKVLKKNSSNKQARLLLAKSYLEVGQGASAEKELRFARKLGVTLSDMPELWGKSLLQQKKFEQIFQEVPLSVAKEPKKRAQLMLVHGYANFALDRKKEAKSLFMQIKVNNYLPAEVDIALARLAISNRDLDLAFKHLDAALLADSTNIIAWLTKGQLQMKRQNKNAARDSFEKVIELSGKTKSISLEFQARVHLAKLALADNNLELAKEKVDLLNKAVPNHPLSKYLSAVVAYQQKDYTSARSLLEKVLSVLPNDLQSKLLLGAVHYVQGNYEQANRYLSNFVENVPTHIQARKMLAAVQLKLGYNEDAYQSLSSALNNNQQDAGLMAMIGQAAINNNRMDEAIDYLKRAKKAKPESVRLRTELAKAYMKKGSFDDAIAELKTVTGQGAMQARNMLVYAHLQNKDIKSARKAAKKLIKDSPESPTPYAIAGTVDLADGDRTNAKVHFLNSLKKQTDFVPALLSLARMAYEDSNIDESENYYNKVLQKDSANEKAFMGLAVLAESKGESDKSVALLEQALNKKPSALSVGLVLGRHYLKIKQTDKGLKLISNMAEHHKDKPGVLSVLVQAQLLAGKKQQALTTAKSITKKWPDLPIGYVEQARVQSALNQNDLAEISLNKALKIKPDLVAAKTGLISLHIKTEQVDKALMLARRLQKQHPKLATGYVIAGDIYMTGKKYRLAQQEYQKALTKQRPTGVVNKLSFAYDRDGRKNKAVKTLQGWLRNNPSDNKSRIQLAILFTQLKDIKNAKSQYQLLLDAKPENVAVLNNLAILYLSSDINKASEYAEKAYRLKPGIAAIADTYGWVLYKAGKSDKSISVLSVAANKSDNPSIHYHYAVALTKSGKPKEAKEVLQKIINKKFDEALDAKKLYNSL